MYELLCIITSEKEKVCDEISFSTLINERGVLADQSQCRSKKSSLITFPSYYLGFRRIRVKLLGAVEAVFTHVVFNRDRLFR
jgi:hypothetical protein